MTSKTADSLNILHYLLKRIEEQQQENSGNEELAKVAKAETKIAYFDFLKSVSSSNKDELNATERAKLDSSLFEFIEATPPRQGEGKSKNNARMTPVPILKWPFVRALEDPTHYRALLGLPQTTEQTRRWLTTIPHQKCKEILKNCMIRLDEKESVKNENDPKDLEWVEQVLVYMTGDGRFKKDLAGYNLQQQSKQSVRENLNQVRKLRLAAEKSASTMQQKQATRQPQEVAAVFVDRDIRLVEKERESRRAADFASHIESALDKK